MKILLTNHSLQYVGGTEKWTHDMARCLAKRGHQVEVLTLMTGMTSEKIEPFARVIDEPAGDYDLVLANHNTAFWRVKGLDAFKVYTSHGPSHHLEQPLHGADAYVGVSRETVAARSAEGFRNMQVITNGVDLTEFCPSDFRQVLIACKAVAAGNMAIEACHKLGLPHTAIHYLSQPVWDTAALMGHIVIGCGRTAIEGLAAGCNVLVFDARQKRQGPVTDGWVTSENVEHLRQVNFSCRAYGHECPPEKLMELLQNIPTEKGWQRAWAEENADIEQKADAYLALRNEDTQMPPRHLADLTAEYELLLEAENA